ncbi:MAG: WbqC family protein [Bacteroidales bacterium]|nr:WbqC family protein [Bacteroidales bacterium]
MLLSTAFLPPLSWFAAAAKDFTLSPDRVFPSVVRLEACEHFVKQSYRNRCRILTANGVENLQVPVLHDEGLYRMPVTEVRVDYTVPWIPKMERALASAYESAAFFEDYRDGLFSILESQPRTLWELNLRLILFLLDRLHLAVDLQPTQVYEPEAAEDLRGAIHPKHPDTILKDLALEKPYFQVFAGKYGFQPNLSVVDLLFNEGPDSILYLKNL